MAVSPTRATAGKVSPKAKKNSVGRRKKIQSATSGKRLNNTTEKSSDNGDDWRFEIKRKKRKAGRKNTGSTAKGGWYYWVVRVRKKDGFVVYYGTLDVLDKSNPERLHKYWKRSKGRR